MTMARNLIMVVLIIIGIGVILWIGLDAVMRGVTEMERNMGGARQAVKNDRVPERDE